MRTGRIKTERIGNADNPDLETLLAPLRYIGVFSFIVPNSVTIGLKNFYFKA